MKNDGSNGLERLGSWKPIASYLNRDERTLRRWKREPACQSARSSLALALAVIRHSHADRQRTLSGSQRPPRNPDVGSRGRMEDRPRERHKRRTRALASLVDVRAAPLATRPGRPPAT